MQTAYAVACFFRFSPKGQLTLERWIDSTMPSEENRRKLKGLCRTHWVEHHVAFEMFVDLCVPVFICLEARTCSTPVEWNSETQLKAQSLY